MHNTYTQILAGIKNYFQKSARSRVVIGVSGGIDSALALKLTVDALSPEKTTALLLPEKSVSSGENLAHAKMLCKYFNVETYEISINKYFPDYMSLPWRPNNLAQINTKARIRMTLLYNFANTKNALVIGTSNKTDLTLGYATKYGDLAADFYVLGDLYKDEIYALAKHLELPQELIEKPATAELYKGQTDESELNMNYDEINEILRKIENGAQKQDLEDMGQNPDSIEKIFRLVEKNKHKISTPFIIKAH